jgi:hypothetical protein
MSTAVKAPGLVESYSLQKNSLPPPHCAWLKRHIRAWPYWCKLTDKFRVYYRVFFLIRYFYYVDTLF